MEVWYEVKAAPLLQFGFLDVLGRLGRGKYGGVGLSVSGPRVWLKVMPSEKLDVRGADEEAVKSALFYAEQFYGHPKVQELLSGDSMKTLVFLNETIPSALGIDGDTELAFGVISGVAASHGVDISTAEAASIAGMGPESRMSVESFADGGFIVDSGDSADGVPPLPVFRKDFPDTWKFVLVAPSAVVDGQHGPSESMLEKYAEADAEINRIVLMKLLPGLSLRRLDVFGDALDRIRSVVEEACAGLPDGPYSWPARDIISKMKELGASAAGQSGWGPVLYALTDGDRAAKALASDVEKYFSGFGETGGLSVNIVSGRNEGTEVKLLRIPL
jgi:beta-ribofuranosylaminobenzene 5'-phosphate synthase